jgi:stage III sporulation protein AD
LAPKFKLFLGVAAGIVFLFTFAKWIEPLYSYIKALTSQGESASYFLLLFKGLGISFLISVSAEICRDMGSEGIASKLELCGKGAVLSLSLPVIKKILEWIGEMAG